MPTYEYVCTSCDNHWEEVQKISEAPLETCPKCSEKTAKRQISGGNFILKGGGWYADLYASSGNKKSGEAKESASSEKSASSSESATTTSTSEKSTTTEKKSPTAPPPATANTSTPKKT